MRWFRKPKEKPTVRVTSEGQTVTTVKELLENPKVQKFMKDFSPMVQKYISANRKAER